MSAVTVRVVRERHTAIRREGLRPGAMHAARPGNGPGEWRTACGETLTDGPRGVLVQLAPELARELIAAGRFCTRCDRVGAATLDP